MRIITSTRLCRVRYAVGHEEACPEAGCPFWEPGGAALDGRCAVERLDLDGRPRLAAWLQQIRKELASTSVRDVEDARRRLYRLLDTGDADGG
jgi:hypothetical protein